MDSPTASEQIKPKSKDVALVLSSGGPRGFAYIGAIEELQRRGYRIRSVAGCSIGSLVGGVFAAGGLEEFKQWLFNLDGLKVMSLIDLRIGKSYIVKGEKVISAIESVVPDRNIEDLDIPYCAVATDFYSGRSVRFTSGNLFDAIRSSISIPFMFRPMQIGHRVLIDGGVVNTMPYDCVVRHHGDILVGFDVNCIDTETVEKYIKEQYELQCREDNLREETLELFHSVLADSSMSLLQKMRTLSLQGDKVLGADIDAAQRNLLEEAKERKLPIGEDLNYYSVLSRSFSLMNHTIAALQTSLYKPDVLARMDFDTYSEVQDYSKGEEIAEMGRILMAQALDRYEYGMPPAGI